MEFRDYCIVIMGDTNGALDEIRKISDNDPKTLNAKGIIICTFNSVADAKELEDYFTSLDRSFVLFEVGAENTGYNIKNKNIHNGLFSHIENDSRSKDLTNKSNRLMNELQNLIPIKKSKSGSTITEEEVEKLPKTDIETLKIFFNNMSDEQREENLNNIIDKGWNNLTELDKQILEYLTKNK